MSTAYFDCFSGASGDMILGAFIDVGLPIEILKAELGKLNVPGFEIKHRKFAKNGIMASQVIVDIEKGHEKHATHLSEIISTISRSGIDKHIRKRALDIFHALAAAEAKVHGSTPDGCHLHEVGALDSLIDVVGSVIGFDYFNIQNAYCSRINLGGGVVKCAHGILPAPAPATLELIKGVPVYSSGTHSELLTPTGAAILTSLCNHFGPMPEMLVESVGYGAGERDIEFPNVLRLVIGVDAFESRAVSPKTVGIIETNIDDMNPELYDNLINLTLLSGALDVCVQPNFMKKNRPGVSLQVICPVEKIDELAELIFKESTAIGLRWRIENRIVTERVLKNVSTKFGEVRVKVAYFRGNVVNIKPENDDCVKLARGNNVPAKQVTEEATRQAEKLF
ncbi:MAG: nickel pincer cofactor biosynthesis protein LarC [Pseudomonadota bacterium]